VTGSGFSVRLFGLFLGLIRLNHQDADLGLPATTTSQQAAYRENDLDALFGLVHEGSLPAREPPEGA